MISGQYEIIPKIGAEGKTHGTVKNLKDDI